MSAKDVLRPDICVVGAGSAGLSVAAGAARFGASVVLVERGAMGGDCLNSGCIPSKALLAAGRAAEAVRSAGAFGIDAGEPVVDFARVAAHLRGVVAAIAPHDSIERFEGLGVRVVTESACFLGPRRLSAGPHRIEARRFVLATGSVPAIPALPGLDAVEALTNETIFALTALPRHLVVLGGGPVGLELAQAFRRLGSRVSVVEAGKALAREDRDLAEVVLARLRGEGIEILEATRAVEAAPVGAAGGLCLTLESTDGARRVLAGSHLLLAAGRRPDLHGLGLDEAGIAHDETGIAVGRDLRTTNRRVYAIGDVVGPPRFTHRAGLQAGLVLRAILFRLPVREDPAALPRATFTDPEIAQVGPNETELRAGGRAFRAVRVPFGENDRAQAERTTDGFLKMLVGRRGRILGAGVVGEGAGEIVSLLSLAVSQGMSAMDLMRFVSPYPTRSEIGKRAAAAYLSPQAQGRLLRGVVRLLSRLG